MRILVLNGSPRPHGNTAEMVAVFKESAEKTGHAVSVIFTLACSMSFLASSLPAAFSACLYDTTGLGSRTVSLFQ